MRYIGNQPRVTGNRIGGGTITTFASTGIDDNATSNKLTITDATSTFGNPLAVTGDATITGNVLPEADSSRDLGTTSVRFANLFVDDITTTTAITAPTINVETALLPDASDGASLGSASHEFSDLFLADGAVINFGDDQEVTLTHNHDVGLTLNTKLVVSGGLEATGTADIQGTFPVLTIKDTNTSAASADAEIVFKDSANTNQAVLGIENNKLQLVTEDNGSGASGITLGLGSRTSNKSFLEMTESGGVNVRVNASNTIAFSNSGTITGSGSQFSAVTVGAVITVSGASQAANNVEFRVINKVGDVLTVVNRDGGNPTTETAGASVTVTEDRKRLITIPDVVETAAFTAPQSDSSTKIATTEYVRTAITNLIGGAPGALDTLDELASALSDDASFASTTTASLANKLDKDFSTLTTAGLESLNDKVADVLVTNGTHTVQGAGNTLTATDNDAADGVDLAIVLNDPTITLSGNVTGSATMTDLQDVSITATLGAVVDHSKLVNTANTNNIVTGLTAKSSIASNDALIIADSADDFKLKKVNRSIVAPPAFTEDLGFFTIAMA
tara:strand:+ start:2973 stop:4658 length:1686 start_codon:yes stop_codon:yes gene_type:complete